MSNLNDIFIRALTRPLWTRGGPVDRLGAILKIGAWLVTLSGLVLAVQISGRMPTPAPIELTHRVSFSQFGLQVVLPSSWKVDADQSGADFSAADLATGAKLVGAVTVSDPPVPDLDAVIDRMIEDARARIGVADSISRGVMGLGLLEARWVKMSAKREGELVQMRTVAVQRGQSTLTLSCSGGAAAQKACDTAIGTVAMAR